MDRSRMTGLWLAALLVAADRASAGPFFIPLGDPTTLDQSIHATGVSGDGLVAIGFTGVGGALEGFRWTQEDGLISLGHLGEPGATRAGNASAHGDVVVGGSSGQAFRWTSAIGMEGLGDLAGGAYGSGASDVSGDGGVIVGTGLSDRGKESFRWTAATGMLGLGDLDGGLTESEAFGVSSDGNVVVGWGSSDAGKEAFRWTSSGLVGLGGLGGLPRFGLLSGANAVSADGSVVVGVASSPTGMEAFRWTASGMGGLGTVPGDEFGSVAFGVSADGSVIVGSAGGNLTAILWTAESGTRSLQEVLTHDHGLDLMGLTLTSANDISSDGRVIVGSGTNALGRPQGWLAVLPEPAAALLLAIAMMAVAALRTRSLRA